MLFSTLFVSFLLRVHSRENTVGKMSSSFRMLKNQKNFLKINVHFCLFFRIPNCVLQ